MGQAAPGCDHWCTLHNDRLYPFPTWEATMSCLTKTCCDKKLDTTHLRKEAASLAGSVVGQAEKAALWAAPHVSKAAGGVARAAKDAQERLEPVVHEARYRVVEDYIPRAQRAAVAAQAAAGTDGTLTERAQRVAVAAKSAALEVPVKKQKKHRVLKTLGWLAVAGAAAAGAYVVWRRSQPVEDPWAEEYWADSTEDEAGYGISPEDAQA